MSKAATGATASAGATQAAATANMQLSASFTQVQSTTGSAASGLMKVAGAADAAGDAAANAAGDFALLRQANAQGFFKDLNSGFAQMTGQTAAAGKGVKLMASDMLNLGRQGADVGVTLAMGMNPFMIAVQQGPQILDALQMAAIRTESTVGAVFKSLATTVWTALVPFIPAIVAIGLAVGTLATMFAIGAKQINDANGSVIDGLHLTEEQLKRVEKSGVNTAVTMGDTFFAVFDVIGDRLHDAFEGPLKWLSDAFNATIDFISDLWITSNKITVGLVLGAFNVIKSTWKMLPAVLGDAIMTGANLVIRGVEWMLNKSIEGLNVLIGWAEAAAAKLGFDVTLGKIKPLNLAELQNSNAGAMREFGQVSVEQMAKGMQDASDIVDGVLSDISKAAIKRAEDRIKAKAGDPDKQSKGPKAAKGGKTQAELTEDFLKDADKRKRALMDERAQIGLTGQALYTLQAQQELMNAANDKGIKMTAGLTAEITKRATELGKLVAENERLRYFEDLEKDTAKRTKELQDEISYIGMNADAVARLRLEKEMLAKAEQALGPLSDEETERVKRQAAGLSDLEEQLKRTTEAFEFIKDTARGFFDDFRNGLAQGKSFFESFGNAVVNALNKIIDKMLDKAFDDFFAKMSGGGSDGGGWFGKLLNIGASLLGGGSGTAASAAVEGASSLTWAAKGEVLGGQTVISHAGGRTMAAEGAGEEAVMPLTRGPDGSLGVQAHGGSGAAPASVTVYVYATEGDMFETRVKAISQDTSIQVVQAGLEQYDEQMPTRVHSIASDERGR
jgi:hypothetical protein